MTIRIRLFLAFLLVVTISGFAAWYSLTRYERQLSIDAGRSSLSSAKGLIDTIDRDIFNRIETLNAFVSTSPEIAALLDQSNRVFAALGPTEAIGDYMTERDLEWSDPIGAPGSTLASTITADPASALLRQFQGFFENRYGYPIFGEIFITNRFGANVAQTAQTSDYRQDDESWWRDAAEHSLSIGDVLFDDSAGIYAVELAVRIDSAAGRRLGVAKAVLNVEEIKATLDAYQADSEFSTLTVQYLDGQNRPILHTGSDDPLAGLDIQSDEDGFVVTADTADGKERLVATARSRGFEDYPWVHGSVRMAIENAELLAPVTEMRSVILPVGLVALLVIGTVAVVIAASLSGPIHGLVAAADQLAKGELNVSLDTTSSVGEVGALTRAMRTMLGNLREAVGRMIGSASQISNAATRLVSVGRELADGAYEQSAACDETSSAIEEMATSIQEVAARSERVVETLVEASQRIEEMGVSVHSVAGRSRDLSAGVEQTLVTMRDMVSSIEAVAGNAAHAKEASNTAVDVAAEGESAVDETVAGMQRMSDSMSDVVKVVHNLDEASRKITLVTRVIEDIAGQSHLLAVNATVQAAHAGEHGRAFAVVADEVGILAERSAAATQEIGTILSDVRGQIEKAIEVSDTGSRHASTGVELAQRAGHALGRIAQAIGSVSAMMTEVSGATSQQANATEKVVATFETMRQLTQQVEETTQQQAAGSEAISRSLEVMQAMAMEVAAAAVEQSQGSEQVVHSMAEITRISSRNADTASTIVRVSEELQSESMELNRVSGFFFAAPDIA